MAGLKSSEIYWVVQSYIGVDGGYLGDMSYRSHREFYPAFCNLDIDPDQFSGTTTKSKFFTILQSQEPIAQAAILRGIAQKYPVGSEHQRSIAAHKKLLELARRCCEVSAVGPPSPEISSQIVEFALKDAAALLENRSPLSAVDRAHTALHGYLKEACHRHDIDVPSDTSATQAFKLLRNGHPTLRLAGTQQDAVSKLLQSMSSVVDALAPLRNRGSLAHANEELLDRAEAVLAINAVNTIIQFLDAKLASSQNQSGPDAKTPVEDA